ncbi:hypothetical protein F4782DRAFT_525409 [Xylaria castorea]|nr:hypothetical protein F4782DRAFT_525409 [Xylaria castorea]
MYSIQASDENPAWRDIIFNSVLNILTIIVVILRLCSRRLTRAGFGWDDCFILFATVIINGMLVVAGSLIYLGFGLPMSQVAPKDLEKVTELERTFRFLFLLCICCVKLSALFFYIRVFGTCTLRCSELSRSRPSENTIPGTNTPLRCISPFLRPFCCFTQGYSLRYIYILIMYMVIAWSIANIVQELAVCSPKEPMCVYQRSTDLGICVFNAVGDLLILLLPLWPIWHLQLSKATKIGVSFLFLLGTVTIAVAFLRFEAIVHTEYGGDYNSTAMKAANYAILEPNLAILCMSLPMVKPLLLKAVSSAKSKLRGRSGSMFPGWWPKNPFAGGFTRWRTGGPSRIFTTPREVPGSSGNNGVAGPRDRNGDIGLTSRARGLWRADSHGSSQHELVELASRPVSASTAGSEFDSLHSEDWPLATPAPVAIRITSWKG